MAITNYKGLMVPTLADATAITTSTTTQELDPAGALVVCSSMGGLKELSQILSHITVRLLIATTETELARSSLDSL